MEDHRIVGVLHYHLREDIPVCILGKLGALDLDICQQVLRREALDAFSPFVLLPHREALTGSDIYRLVFYLYPMCAVPDR